MTPNFPQANVMALDCSKMTFNWDCDLANVPL